MTSTHMKEKISIHFERGFQFRTSVAGVWRAVGVAQRQIGGMRFTSADQKVGQVKPNTLWCFQAYMIYVSLNQVAYS